MDILRHSLFACLAAALLTSVFAGKMSGSSWNFDGDLPGLRLTR
jgi:hypothetical protein